MSDHVHSTEGALGELPRSPCIGVCVLDPREVCVGCQRSLEEIGRWTRVDDDGRRSILRAAERRRIARDSGAGPASGTLPAE